MRTEIEPITVDITVCQYVGLHVDVDALKIYISSLDTFNCMSDKCLGAVCLGLCVSHSVLLYLLTASAPVMKWYLICVTVSDGYVVVWCVCTVSVN